jgi:hypothetical protein
MALAEVPPDPDMCVHLCPALGAGVVDALGAGLTALAGVLLDEEVVDDTCVPGVELVEALAIVSPNARVAPSIAAPTAVPMRGLVILTRVLLSPKEAVPGDPPGPSRPTAPDGALRGPSQPALNPLPGCAARMGG